VEFIFTSEWTLLELFSRQTPLIVDWIQKIQISIIPRLNSGLVVFHKQRHQGLEGAQAGFMEMQYVALHRVWAILTKLPSLVQVTLWCDMRRVRDGLSIEDGFTAVWRDGRWIEGQEKLRKAGMLMGSMESSGNDCPDSDWRNGTREIRP
jgi:hypothetical protein